MKKILALMLALCMVFSLCACGAKTEEPAAEAPAAEAPAAEAPAEEAPAEEAPAEEAPAEEAPAADGEIPDNMTSEDGKYQLAFVTDVGQLHDGSFNEGTWNGVKAYAAANGMSYKYYQPANGNEATDDDRYDAMKAAAEAGAEVVVCAGFMQATALTKAAEEFPEVNFVFIDGWPLGLKNVAPIAFAEEQSGYLAGYAIVKEGFTKIGFAGGGGGTNPACCRYGYGFAQGISAAAAELGVETELKYSWQYGAAFSGSPELQTMLSGWYETGTEIIFVCGGSMFDSGAAAASANDAYMVGEDVDRSLKSDTVVTSAMKGLAAATEWAIAKHYDGEWETVGDVPTVLDAKDGACAIPTATWSMENYTVEEYEAQLAAIIDGSLVIDNTVYENDAIAGIEFENLTVIYE